MRVLRDTQAQIRVTLTNTEGAAADATGTPTVTIVRDSTGATVVSGAGATDVTGTGVYAYTLLPSQIPEVDILEATWSATVEGQSQQFVTQVEVVGGWLCSLEDIKGSLPVSMQTTTNRELSEAREWAEDLLEQACGVAFRPRYGKETVDGTASADLLLSTPAALKVLSASVGGEAIATGEVSPQLTGSLYREAGWARGRENVTVAYVHGFSSPPAPVRRAAVKLARAYLIEDPSNLNERATSISTEEATYSLVTAGVRSARTSIPEVNQVIEEYGFVSI